MISALPVPPIATQNDDIKYEVWHRNITKDKVTLNTMTANTILTCSCSSLLSKRVSFVDIKRQPTARFHVITVPPKIWRPKMMDTCIHLPPHTDVDEGLYLSPSCGLAIRRTKLHPPKITNRVDLLLWNESLYASQLKKHLHLSSSIDTEVQDTILQVIKDNWDAFDEHGVNQPVIGYEFCIDTGASSPVCCRVPKYGIHESNVMKERIQALDNN